ncbi:hypothetical protein DYI42_14125 [Vannielia litorea]|nr:hypothetical protein [Vannielia litorea]
MASAVMGSKRTFAAPPEGQLTHHHMTRARDLTRKSVPHGNGHVLSCLQPGHMRSRTPHRHERNPPAKL